MKRLLISLLAVGLAPVLAQPLPCGTILTRSTVLRANVGPCAQTALRVPMGADHITIDLNGHRILGTGMAGSAGIEVRAAMVTVQGPGTISSFDRGVSILVPGAWWEPRGATVQRLNLEGNRIGVYIEPDQFVEAYGLNRVLRNTITGPGQTGIYLDRIDQTEIARNNISGQEQFGIRAVVSRHISASDNNLTRNNVGVSLDHWSDQAVLSGNDISANRTDGIQTASRGILIEGNDVSRNGRDGIVVSQFLVRVHDNRVFNNERRGIAVVTLDLSPNPGLIAPDTHHVTGNDARNNAVDLFWDQTGRRNCWADNRVRTTAPSQLPVCP